MEHLIVTIGHQPLAALAAIVTLKPSVVVPIVSQTSAVSLQNLEAATKSLTNAPIQFLQPVTVMPHDPQAIVDAAEALSQQRCFAASHLAYTGGTKPMGWAFAAVWDDRRSADARAWYVADDLGLLIPDSGAALLVDQTRNLDFTILAGMHGWLVKPGPPVNLRELDREAQESDKDASVTTQKKVARPAFGGGPSHDIRIAVVQGWRLTTITPVPSDGKRGDLLSEQFEIARAVGGSLARAIVDGGTSQPGDSLGNLDHRGSNALHIRHRLGAESFAALNLALARPSVRPPTEASRMVGANPPLKTPGPSFPGVPHGDGALFVTLGLNPLAAVAAVLAHQAAASATRRRIERVALLHTSVLTDDEDDPGFVAHNRQTGMMLDELTSLIGGLGVGVSAVTCGPHDAPTDLARGFEGLSSVLRGASLDATGGTKALTLAATRAWRHANPGWKDSEVPLLTYTRTAKNWIHLRSLNAEQFVVASSIRIAPTQMAALHGYPLVESETTQKERAQAPPVRSALEAAGWQVEVSKKIKLVDDMIQFDLIAVKGLVVLVVELKSKEGADVGALARTVERSRIVGGSLALAAVVAEKARSDALIAARFPGDTTRWFTHQQTERLVAWAETHAAAT